MNSEQAPKQETINYSASNDPTTNRLADSSPNASSSTTNNLSSGRPTTKNPAASSPATSRPTVNKSADSNPDSHTPRGAHRPHVLLAIDSFKGCATSAQVEAWLAEGIRHSMPDAHIEALPIADGGEGTTAAIQLACNGTWHSCTVHGPLENLVAARYVLIESTPNNDSSPNPAPYAVIEMAEAAGIQYSSGTHADALTASTYGVGELVLDAIDYGARRLYLGIGGSATNDGGAGFLQALGAQLLDAHGRPIGPGLAGLAELATIDLTPAVHALAGIEIVVLCDVTNPLLGPRGALTTFGPQKGLQLNGAGSKSEYADLGGASGAPKPSSMSKSSGAPGPGGMPEPDSALKPNDAHASDTLEQYEQWMRAYAAKLSTAPAPALAEAPGAGAAGGLGVALLALGAQLAPGIQIVLDLIDFDEAARQADFIITGEGNMDAQTAAGKAPVGVAQRAHAANPQVAVAAVCGGRDRDLDSVYARGIDFVLPIARRPMPLSQALLPQEARANLIAAGETLARIMQLML